MNGGISPVLSRFPLFPCERNSIQVRCHFGGHQSHVLFHNSSRFLSVWTVGRIRVLLLREALCEQLLVDFLRLPDGGPFVSRQKAGEGDTAFLLRFLGKREPGTGESCLGSNLPTMSVV